MISARPLAIAIGVMLAAASRLVPHPPNVTPIAAMALFGGAYFSNLAAAYVVPLAAMLLSDLVLGFHPTMPYVYVSFLLIVLIGTRLRRRTGTAVAAAALASSVLFYLITNFGVWVTGTLYPKTWAGLMTAYAAALPFFRNTLIGDLAYVTALFGGFALLERYVPALREGQRLGSSIQ